MANLSINYFAIKAQPEAMKEFIMCAARKRGVTCDAATAAEALDLLLSSKLQINKDDWREEGKVYMSDFAESDLESELSYLRLMDTADGKSPVLLFESRTSWEPPQEWICKLSELFDIEINWYSTEEFNEWKMINGESFSGGLVAPDGRCSLDDSFGVTGQIAVEADMMARSVIGGYTLWVKDSESADADNDSDEDCDDDTDEEDEGKEADALYDEGLMAYEDEDEHTAFEKFRAAAEMGHVEAMDTMGQIYGWDAYADVKQDYAKSLEWLERAADQEYRPSQYRIGEMCLLGNGVQQDLQKAYNYLVVATKPSRKYAALFDDGSEPFAFYLLGLMYLVGAGIGQDFNKAFVYFYNAYNRKVCDSYFKLVRCYELGLGTLQNLPKAKELRDYAEREGLTDKMDVMIPGFELPEGF